MRARHHGVVPVGLRDAVVQVGDRWTLLVVHALLGGPRRFNELLEDLGGIAPNVLSQRLRRLEDARLVVVEPYSDRPPRYSYRLSSAGAQLGGALRLLTQWGTEHGGPPGDRSPVVHDACGTPPEARWWCPTCDRLVADEELGEGDLRWM